MSRGQIRREQQKVLKRKACRGTGDNYRIKRGVESCGAEEGTTETIKQDKGTMIL